MIERNMEGEFEVSCDNCSEQQLVDPDSWNAMLRQLRSNGWRIQQVSGEWEHLCPTCVLEESELDGGGMPDEGW